MFPIQITVAKSHSKSREIFFQEFYKMWTKPLTGFDVVLQFLWVTPERRQVVEHAPSRGNWPAHKENYIPLQDVNSSIWWEYRNALDQTDGEADEAAQALQATSQALQATSQAKEHNLRNRQR
jgi:hypothetical protein